MEVPKIIHQTWKTKDIPSGWKVSVEGWKKLHPNWYYHSTTDVDNRRYIVDNYPQYLKTYDNLPHPIQRADMIRYIYLYDMGGVYSDLDIVPLRPLSDYPFETDCEVYVCNSGNTKSVFTNSFMISKPKCRLWLDLLEHIKNYRKWPLTIRHLEIMYSTGPLAYTKVIKSYIKHGGRVCILPTKLFMPFSLVETETMDCKSIAIQKGYFNYPIVGNSWHSWDSKLINFFLLNKDTIILVLVLIIILYIGVKHKV
jgi:inositol phosphorylceramide mannosyltransferase catalytic subunit